MRALVATLSVFLSASVAGAQTTITFDPAPEGPLVGGFARIGGYVEGGMVFTANPEPGSTIVSEASGNIPSNGTAFLLKCGSCAPSMRAVDGGTFDLLSLDVGEPLLFGFYGPFATGTTVTGSKEDGTTVSAAFTTDGVTGFETVELGDDFLDLASVTISTGSPFGALAIDDLTVVVGSDKATLAVSPPSGAYVTTQAFDLTLIVAGGDAASAEISSATLDGVDFTNALAACAIDGSLEAARGVTFRCPLALDPGTHSFEATVELGDGMTATDATSWEVFESSEP